MGRSKHCDPVTRNNIKKLYSAGHSYRKIAEILGVSKTLVSNAVKWIPRSEKRGRIRKITQVMKRNIIRCVKINPFITSREIKSELKLTVHTSTIRRTLIEANWKSHTPRKVPMLSQRNIQQRLSFVENHIGWPVEKWRNILWSDETKINLFNSDRGIHHVRRPTNSEFNPKYTLKTVKHGGGNIMVWGSFSYYGVGPLYRIQGNMTAEDYVEILQYTMLPYADDNMPLRWVFQQDNDPKHTARCTKRWFNENHIHVLPWPAQSPDLNPIENLWSILKTSIKASHPRNCEQLWQLVREAWEAIPVSTCQNLVNSMRRRCQAVLKNKGSTTKY